MQTEWARAVEAAGELAQACADMVVFLGQQDIAAMSEGVREIRERLAALDFRLSDLDAFEANKRMEEP